MDTESSGQPTPDELAEQNPGGFLQKYFLDDHGRPDRSKTPDVLALSNQSDVDKVHVACRAVVGLHSVSGGRYNGNMVFVGWDLEGVTDARRAHIVAAERLHVNIHDAISLATSLRHAGYLDDVECRNPGAMKTLVGRYILDCSGIVQEFGHLNSEMSLDVEETGSPGVFEASVKLRVIHGHLILSAVKRDVDDYLGQLDRAHGRVRAQSCCEDDKENRQTNQCAPSNKRRNVDPPKGPHKKAKKSAAKPRKFFFKLIYKKTNEGGTSSTNIIDGAVLFESTNYFGFVCKMDIPGVGPGVHFTGLKVSNESATCSKWSDYAEQDLAYRRFA